MQVSPTPTAVSVPSKQLGTLTYLNARGQVADTRPVYAGKIQINIDTRIDPIPFRGSFADAIKAAKDLSRATVYPQAIAVIKDGPLPRSFTLAGVWGAPDSGFPLLPVDSYRMDRVIDGHGYATDVTLDARAFSGLKAVVGFERVVR